MSTLGGRCSLFTKSRRNYAIWDMIKWQWRYTRIVMLSVYIYEVSQLRKIYAILVATSSFEWLVIDKMKLLNICMNITREWYDDIIQRSTLLCWMGVVLMRPNAMQGWCYSIFSSSVIFARGRYLYVAFIVRVHLYRCLYVLTWSSVTQLWFQYLLVQQCLWCLLIWKARIEF